MQTETIAKSIARDPVIGFVLWNQIHVSHTSTFVRIDMTLAPMVANQKGLVLCHNEGKSWRFSHDQMQMVGCAFTPEGEQKVICFNISCVLLATLGHNLINANFSVVVNQSHLGAQVFEHLGERDQMAALLLEAARKATNSGSFGTASLHPSTSLVAFCT